MCLIRPPGVEALRFSTASFTPPLGLAFIAGSLEASGRDVTVIDALAAAPTHKTRYIRGYLVGLDLAEVVRRIPARTRIVGISVVFTHEWPAVVRLISLIKQARPDVFVMVGGEHVSSMTEFSLLSSEADALVMGEGEETAVELVEAVEQGRSLEGIAGVAYRAEGEVVINPRRARRRDIDEIPWPAWHLIDLDTYHANRFIGGLYSASKTIPMLATRGCPYQCTYCSAPNMWEPKWIARDPKLVVDEIEYYVNTFGARNFPFQDLTAIIKRDWIVDFCNEIIDRGLQISWQLPTGTRSEAIDEDVARLLKRSGLVTMSYAPESGSDETRKLIKKKMHKDKLYASIEAARNADLDVTVFLVVGFPHDTPKELAENFPFLERLAELGISEIGIAFYMALPGTEIFESLFDDGKLTFDRRYFGHILSAHALWPATSYCNMSKAELARWKLRFFLHFYSKKPRPDGEKGLGNAFKRALSGLVERGDHSTRMQTVVRNGLRSAKDTLVTRFQPRWMTVEEEAEFFAGWNELLHSIRKRQIEAGVAVKAPADTRELHTVSVLPRLRKRHGQRHTYPLSPDGSSSPALAEA